MKFQFDSLYDRRHMASLLHAVNYLSWAAKPNTKKLWTLSRKYAPLVTIAGAAVFLLATVTVQNVAAMLVGIVILAVGVKMGQRPAPTGRAVKQLWRSYDKRGMEIKFCFDEDGMDFCCGGESEPYPYDRVVRVLEDPQNFFISFNDRGVACVLVKRELTQGTVDEFRRFMENKTGKPVEYFK